MKLLLLPVIIFLISCSQPTAYDPPTTTTTTIPEDRLGPEYDAFYGDFAYTDYRGFKVLVSFLGDDKAMSVCITANATIYTDYTFTLDNGTITTYDGEYPIIWYFECKGYPYVWEDADTLIVTDPVNNRTLTLRRR